MPKKPDIDHKEKDSLVPAISREEDRLKTSLDEARVEAARIVADAERAGEEKTRKAAEELPGLMEQRRSLLLQASTRRAQALREELAVQTRDLLKKAQNNVERAVSLVVAAVWPGEPK